MLESSVSGLYYNKDVQCPLQDHGMHKLLTHYWGLAAAL